PNEKITARKPPFHPRSREFYSKGFTENREPRTGNYTLRRGPLGNNEFATMLLFQRHGRIESDDRAFHFAVVRRLRRDALQPQPGSCHQRKERAAMLGREADDLIRNPRNHGQESNALPEPRPERRQF